MYLGVGLGSGVRTDYDMVHFRQPPRQCTHLAGKSLYNVPRSVVQIKYAITYIFFDRPGFHKSSQAREEEKANNISF